MNSASAGTARWAKLLGSQTPRIELVPPYATTTGPEACELAEMAGLIADDWQRRVLDGALGVDDQNQTTAPEVGLVVARQNGKGSIVEIATLNGLYLRRHKMVYTSHLMATSRKIRERIQFLIESVPDLDREVKQIRMSNEEQSIVLKAPKTIILAADAKSVRRFAESARIDFVARTPSAARGWAGYDVIFFDEAFALTAEMVGGMMPIMFARSNWQIWYVSMAGKITSTALRQVRVRALEAEPELAYYEWSVDESYHEAPELVRNMPVAWAAANPALGRRITVQTIRRALRSMDPAEFAREVLCAWDDPAGMSIINLAHWAQLAEPDSEIHQGMVFALDVAEDLTSGSIGVCGYRSDGIPHVEITSKDGVLDHRRGTSWIVPRVKELNDKWQPVIWIVDATGPAGALLPELAEAGVTVTPLTAREAVQADMGLLAAIQAPERDQLRHLGQPQIAAAIKAAQRRNSGDGGWAFARRDAALDISPLKVCSQARYGLVLYGALAYDPLESVH
jgi:hypothetical protein